MKNRNKRRNKFSTTIIFYEKKILICDLQMSKKNINYSIISYK